ncbi:MAG: SGNH/GDSL hydrolase family protein, partial [Ruminococcus sp.]|nr:SGNH/GDSL hydrolase family protein [Ruminococcus sp.]
FFSNPLLPLLVILCSVLAMMFTGDGHSSHLKAGEPEYIRAVVPLNVISDSESTSPAASSTTAAPSAQSTTAFTMTAASAAVTTEAVTTTTAAPAEETTSAESTTEADSAEETDEPRPERPQVSDYKVHVDADSENSAYYQSNLVILGDSIAYGFNAYGYIPNEHNVAAESMALWNMSRYSFNLGGGSMGAVDAAVYTDSPLIYISIGMNDILGTNPDDYASKVYGIAQQLVDSLPDTTVIIGAITPIGPPSTYTTNDTIDSFNYAAESTVDAYGSPQILFFDANAVLKDPNTGALASNVSGGDGLHISGASYGYILNALFSYLDTTDTLDRMHQHDEKYE